MNCGYCGKTLRDEPHTYGDCEVELKRQHDAIEVKMRALAPSVKGRVIENQTENDLAELAKLQTDEIVRLRGACRRVRSLCKQCWGRGIVADKVIDMLTEVLEGEAE